MERLACRWQCENEDAGVRKMLAPRGRTVDSKSFRIDRRPALVISPDAFDRHAARGETARDGDAAPAEDQRAPPAQRRERKTRPFRTAAQLERLRKPAHEREQERQSMVGDLVVIDAAATGQGARPGAPRARAPTGAPAAREARRWSAAAARRSTRRARRGSPRFRRGDGASARRTGESARPARHVGSHRTAATSVTLPSR